MNIAAIIVGIEGWQGYTLPLVESLRQHEPLCSLIVVDNASAQKYPIEPNAAGQYIPIWRTRRLCYSAAINEGKKKLDEFKPYDWYIVLSNDVLCSGPFAHILAEFDQTELVGPLLKENSGFEYLEGWCVCVPRAAWDAIGGWDEAFVGSDYEDMDFSTTAREKGFALVEAKDLTFVHLDQRQRYSIVPDFAAKDEQNRSYFMRKHARVTA